MNRTVLAGIFFMFLSVLGYAEDGSGLKISGAADLNATLGLDKNSPTLNRFTPRETELLLMAPADWLFDGQINAAAHEEDGEFKFELHEAFIGSSRLIPRSRFRAGMFFLGVGRLNSTHRHDWPFISAPKVQATFFDDHGIADTGLEYSYLAPTPFYLDFTVGFTNGWNFGHAHSVGTKPNFPTHYLRAVTYTKLPWDGGAQIGLNYLGRRPADGTKIGMFGLDFVAKWREATNVSFLIQSELWYRVTEVPGSATDKSVGMYFFPNYHIGNGLYAGMRLDLFSVRTAKNGFGDPISSYDWAVVPMLSYKASEFSTIRLAYNYKESRLDGQLADGDKYIEAQAVFILGAHPAHDF